MFEQLIPTALTLVLLGIGYFIRRVYLEKRHMNAVTGEQVGRAGGSLLDAYERVEVKLDQKLREVDIWKGKVDTLTRKVDRLEQELQDVVSREHECQAVRVILEQQNQELRERLLDIEGLADNGRGRN